MPTEAIIYVRVSSPDQVKDGHGLEGQERRCLTYARSQRYRVLKTFREAGIQGWLTDRPSMNALIEFLDTRDKSKEPVVVIFDDIKRFARNLEGHLLLKKELYSRNATVESPSMKFEDTPEGRFIEIIFAAAAQLERDQNARQVRNRMRSRLEAGFYCFRCAPPGYIYLKDPQYGKILKRVEPDASIYKTAIEMYATSPTISYTELANWISEEFRKNNIKKQISIDTVKRRLQQYVYAGYVASVSLGVTLRKGVHEPLITPEIYELVQEKMHGNIKPVIRRDYNDDFPLRNLVSCSVCLNPFTASWSKGRNARYPYYRCNHKGCPLKNVSIPRSLIENEFAHLLKNVRPESELLSLTKAVFLDVWNEKKLIDKNEKHKLRLARNSLKADKEGLLKLMMRSPDESTMRYYEAKLQDMVIEDEKIEDELSTTKYSDKDFGTALDKVFKTLERPDRTWKKGNLYDKRTIVLMYFDGNLHYDQKGGFGTTTLAPVVGLIGTLQNTNSRYVEMVGIEPTSAKA